MKQAQDPPAPGLRERKKAATMRHIQATAMELFLQRGFDEVTIDEVAEAAEVSPRTVYRYFGTKEGLVLQDEYDDQITTALSHFMNEGLSPLEAADAVLGVVEEDHFVADEAATRERVRLFFENPTLRSAGYLHVDERIDELASAMAATSNIPLTRARIMSGTVVWTIVVALRTWHEADDGPMLPFIREAMTTLRTLAGSPD